jgi:hypothetical protein
MLLGKLVIYLQKTETRSMPITVLESTQSGLRTLISDPKPCIMLHRKHEEFGCFRVLGSTLRLKAEANPRSRGQKDFICSEEERKVHGGMQWDPETSGLVGQVGNWVFIAFFLYCPRVEMSLRCKQTFSGREKCLLGLLGPSAVHLLSLPSQ